MTPGRRELFISVLLTPLYIAVRGYTFGIRDHGIHLPYILRIQDASFLPGDPMLDLIPRHPSLFFHLCAFLSNVLSVEAVFFMGYVIAVFAVLAGTRALAKALFDDAAGEWAAAIALVGVFVQRHVVGGIENLDFLFLPRVASLGPLLFAFAWGVRGRYRRAFLMLGVVFLFHATTASHAAFMLGVACLFGGRKLLKETVIGSLLFLVAASPLLLWSAVSGGSSVPSPAPMEWIDSVRLHFPLHHFAPVWGVVSMAIPVTLSVMAGVLVLPWKTRGRTVAGFLVGGLLLIVAGWVGNRILRSPTTIQLHLFQAGRMLDYLAVVALGGWTYWAFCRSRVLGGLALVATAAFFIRGHLYLWLHTSVDAPILAVCLLGTGGILARERFGWWRGDSSEARPGESEGHSSADSPGEPTVRRPSLMTGAVIAAFLAVLLVLPTRGDVPWHLTGATQPGYRVMRWADEHLPPEALVIVPPYLAKPITAFRYFGRRRIIGSWKDGGEGTFDYRYQLKWEKQVRSLTGVGDTLRKPTQDLSWPAFESMLLGVRWSYNQQKAGHFRYIGGLWRATHILRERGSSPLALPVLYSDDEFVLYALKPR